MMSEGSAGGHWAPYNEWDIVAEEDIDSHDSVAGSRAGINTPSEACP